MSTLDSEMMREIVAEGTAAGMKRAFADPETWSAALQGMGKRAEADAGSWLIKKLRGLASKMALFLVAGLLVYLAGGWSALVAFWKALQ